MLPVALADIHDWLLSVPPEATVGYARRAERCPVAHYLYTTSPLMSRAQVVALGRASISINGRRIPLKLDDPAKRFVQFIDGLEPRGESCPVSCALALRLAERALRGG